MISHDEIFVAGTEDGITAELANTTPTSAIADYANTDKSNSKNQPTHENQPEIL